MISPDATVDDLLTRAKELTEENEKIRLAHGVVPPEKTAAILTETMEIMAALARHAVADRDRKL